MGLFYITPHYQCYLEELPVDCDTSWFVIADTARNAIQFWIEKINEFTGVEVTYAGAIHQAWVDEMVEQNRANRVIEVRDLSFDQYANHGAVPWENILPTHFQIAEV